MKTSDGFVRADSRNLPKVELPRLLEYIHNNDVYNASEIRVAKTPMSSRDSYVDTAIDYVEVKREEIKCVLKAKVTTDHRIRTKMYSINEDSVVIENLICDVCAASAGGCKQGICFAHWIIKRTEEPSVTTSVSCYCKKPRVSEAIIPRKQEDF
ncbi:unnamed protein product [Parnassius apollo]|uniref:(apollo) hypothetical protein n=1 Tax=Parnassius apollo TaxID=110799 RepID=A0A8S3W3R2_PARAO|nr:unnamed protein product [Parnassius apollo]